LEATPRIELGIEVLQYAGAVFNPLRLGHLEWRFGLRRAVKITAWRVTT